MNSATAPNWLPLIIGALSVLCVQDAAFADVFPPIGYEPAVLPIGVGMFVGGLGMIGFYIAKRNSPGFAKFKKPVLVFGLLSFMLSFIMPVLGLRLEKRPPRPLRYLTEPTSKPSEGAPDTTK